MQIYTTGFNYKQLQLATTGARCHSSIHVTTNLEAYTKLPAFIQRELRSRERSAVLKIDGGHFSGNNFWHRLGPVSRVYGDMSPCLRGLMRTESR